MKKQLFSFCFLVVFCLFGYTQNSIPLYKGKAPNSREGVELNDSILGNQTVKSKKRFIIRVGTPELIVFLPEKSKSTGVGVIICPGGGYLGLSIDNEGHAIAERLIEKGIAAFILKYRLPNSLYVKNKDIVPLEDAQRAIQLVRENAKKWGVNPNKIGIEGNSAGGHLASTAGTHYEKSFIDNPLKLSLRPDFMILNYPVISMADSLTHMGSRFNLIGKELTDDEQKTLMKNFNSMNLKLAEFPIDLTQIKEFSNELHVTANTPPTFITHAVDDDVVKIQNSLLFIAALQKNKVAVESFFYAKGKHGYGIDNPSSEVEWIDSCINWIMKKIK